MPDTRTATVERLLNDIRRSLDTGQGLRRRIAAIRASGLASSSDIDRLEYALESSDSDDMWDNVPV